MRPHLLELSAFGAFPGDVSLDLDALGESGLVLLCGDTGGGKTTLLDALGFALYGVVPGERQKAKEDLRSHHAVEGAVARVRLEFTARGRRLRITRTPLQSRPKKRGEGVVVDNPTALLEKREDDGTWAPLATRPEDVGLEVLRLLGMDADQFFQVVVLPQGRFAAFLQSDHKDREKLLKQLFHVHRFESAERWLADRSARAAATVEQARQTLAQVAARVAQESGLQLPEHAEAEPDWAEVAAAAASTAAASAAADAARLQAARAVAASELAAAEGLLAAQSARRRAEQELAALEADDPAVGALRAELAAALRAAPVSLALAAAAEADAELVHAAAEAERALAAVVGLGGAADDVTGQARALTNDAVRLERLAEVQQRAVRADRSATEASQVADRLDAEVVAAQEWLRQLPTRRDELARLVDDARAAAMEVPELRVARDAAAERQRLVGELQDLEAGREALVLGVGEAERRVGEARAAADALLNERVDALIGELAFRLEDDCPCPVCGSLSHPDVTTLQAGGDVGKELELAARRAADVAGEAAAAAAQELAVHDDRLAGLRARLGGGAPHDTHDTHDADGDLELDLGSRLRAVELRAAALPGAEQQLALLAAESEQRGADLARLETRVQEERKRAAEAVGERVTLLELLTAEDVDPDTDLTARGQALLRLAAACDVAAAADASLATREVAAGRARLTAQGLLAQAGFDDVAAALAAARDDDWTNATGVRIADHEAGLAGVRARLAAPELDVPLDPPAPVGACAEALALVVADHEQAVGQAELLTSRATALTELVPAYSLAQQAIPPLVAHHATVRGLSELAAGRGDNRLSMPLSTFVLAARLEEVAQAASLRLTRMSGGRYTLQHTDAGRDRRSRAGLGLSVADGWTGRTRDTATLSGGETFMTALSLALGLADVVTAEAGGQSIDALFVDEGFGTLDGSSLDQVMDVLDELRSGGRLVGVVSHVAELRVRIPAQIQVQKGMHGSTVVTT